MSYLFDLVKKYPLFFGWLLFSLVASVGLGIMLTSLGSVFLVFGVLGLVGVFSLTIFEHS